MRLLGINNVSSNKTSINQTFGNSTKVISDPILRKREKALDSLYNLFELAVKQEDDDVIGRLSRIIKLREREVNVMKRGSVLDVQV